MSFNQQGHGQGQGQGQGVNTNANHFSHASQQQQHIPLQPHLGHSQNQQSFQNYVPFSAFPDQSGPSGGASGNNAGSYLAPNLHSQFSNQSQAQHSQGQFMPDFNAMNMNMNMNMNQFQSGQSQSNSNSMNNNNATPTPMQMSMMNNLARFQGQQPGSQQQFNLNNGQGQGQGQGQHMGVMPFNNINASNLNNGMGNASGMGMMAPPAGMSMANMANGNAGMSLGNPNNAMRAYQAQLQAQAGLINQNAMNQSQANSPANSHIQPPSRQGSVLAPQTPVNVNASQTPSQGQGQVPINTQNAIQNQKRAASRPGTGSSMPQTMAAAASTEATTTEDNATSNANANGTGTPTLEAQRVALLFDINTILFKEVLALQAAGKSAQVKTEGTADDPAKSKQTPSKEYAECMRRIGANLSYLAASANPEFKKAESAFPAIAETIPSIQGNAMSQGALDDLNDKYARLLTLWPEYKQTGFPKNVPPPNAPGNPQMQQAMMSQQAGMPMNGMKVPTAVQR